jgi:hypothetical protein
MRHLDAPGTIFAAAHSRARPGIAGTIGRCAAGFAGPRASTAGLSNFRPRSPMTCPASKRCPLLMLSDRPPYESSPHAAPAYAPGELLHVFLAPFSPMVFRRTFGVSSRGRGRPVTMHGALANRGMRPDWSAFTCPRFSRKPRTLTLPTRLGCAFGPPRILRSHASDESLQVTWNGRTTPLARRDDRAGRDIGRGAFAASPEPSPASQSAMGYANH